MFRGVIARELPKELEALPELALNLRFTWSEVGEKLWRTLSPEIWEDTRNPWVILQNVPKERFEELLRDAEWMGEFQDLLGRIKEYIEDPCWYGRQYPAASLKGIAYFSMEFGVSEALPLYAGGLGVLAGDFLKTANDLGLPVIGIGLLYQEGYFRQLLDASGWQQEAYPYNEPASLPIQPVLTPSGTWQHVSLGKPGRRVLLRIWRADIGRVPLYLLDSNDPLNGPLARGITSKLYGGGTEMRLMQELVLGLGGWHALKVLGHEVDVCHLNEGHAAFAVLERARQFKEENGCSFWEALWATRSGNIFTTHTPVSAGFDTFSPALVGQFFSYWSEYFDQLGITLDQLLALGRKDPRDLSEPFNMAYLAMRGCSRANGVSRLHGAVSRHIFRDLYPGRPEHEVPVEHVTNGIHVPSWHSAEARNFWTRTHGESCWLGEVEGMCAVPGTLEHDQLWALRNQNRASLVRWLRKRLTWQVVRRGGDSDLVDRVRQVFDPNTLTLGFARRFTEYKRPNLLLRDRSRLIRILSNEKRPVQLVIAGKAHPNDGPGKGMLREWAEFVKNPDVRSRVSLIEDYDMSIAQELVQGVDVWINTPRRPWEASGTSGMKVLANGGLNLSELDGWWAEAYLPSVGWAIGDGREHPEPEWDAKEAEELYRVIEDEIVPEFYDRDAEGIPRKWMERMRASMTTLAPEFSGNRMVLQYLQELYLPSAGMFKDRSARGGRLAKELYAWETRLRSSWDKVHFGACESAPEGDRLRFVVEVYLGDLSPRDIYVEMYADPAEGGPAAQVPMVRTRDLPGSANGHIYEADFATTRPAEHFTPRIVPFHPDALVPMETGLICWYR